LSIAAPHIIQIKKWIVLLLYPLFCSTSLLAQNTYVKSNPFPTDYFIQNKGQWNHEDSSIGYILWNGIHNVHLFKNKPGFTWKFTPVKLHKEDHENEFSGIESESEKERERERELEAGNAKEKSHEITQVFLNANPNPEIIEEKPSDFYWTYGPEKWNSIGFKRITYKNIYPFIDVYYESCNNPAFGNFKYGFILHPSANPNHIQMQLKGAKFKNINENSVQYFAKDFTLIDSGWNATQNEKNIPLKFKLAKSFSTLKNTLQINLNCPYPIQSETIIDPYVSVINSILDSGSHYNNFTNLISQMDYDNDDNAYIMSIALKYPEVAQFDKFGKLQWIFTGLLPTLKWQSALEHAVYAPGAILVNKLINKIYFCPGADAKNGPRIIQLNSSGNYNNYISNSRADAMEAWDLGLHCKTKTLFASGGGTNAAYNLFTVDQQIDSIRAKIHLITNDSISRGQDMIRSIIDKKGNYFTIINYQKKYNRYNQMGYIDSFYFKYFVGLYFVNDALNGYKYSLNLSNYFKFIEANNCPNNNFPNNNRFNGLAVNDSFVFSYDGKVLVINEKFTGKIRCIDSVAWHKGKRGHLGQSGISADNCNHVFVGGDSANVLVYTFAKNKLKLDTTIYLFKPAKIRKVIDIRLNELSNQLFVAGDSFTASFPNPFAKSCSVVRTFKVDTILTSKCQGNFIAKITNADSITDYTFQWTKLNAKNQPIVQLFTGSKHFYDTLKNPNPGDTFELLVAKNYFCNGEYQKFIFTTGKMHKIDVYDTLCAGEIYTNRKHKIFKDSTFPYTLSNRYKCDSVVTYHIHFKDTSHTYQKVVRCRGDSLKVGKHVYTNAGFFKDTLVNKLGCDSFIYSKFSIASDTVYLKKHVCNTYLYKLGDSSFYKPGNYKVVFQSSKGCDSVVFAKISMSRDTAVRIRPNICQGDSFVLQGMRYKLAGNYQTKIPRFDGCDSTIRITLSVKPQSFVQNNVSLCFGDSLLVGKKFYKKTGKYMDTLKSLWGCDSVVNSTIVVHPKYDTTAVYILCGDSTVVINNVSYSSSTNFNFKHTSFAGCDSMVRYKILKTKLTPDFAIDSSQVPEFTFTNASRDAIKFIWSFDDGYKDSTRAKLTYQFNKIDNLHRICLRVTDSLGCIDSTCINIPPSKISFDLYNSFSPNGDGINDQFAVMSKGKDLQYDLMIFNRWGAKVYEVEHAYTRQPNLYWNGRVMNNGAECPAATYFALYTLYLNGPNNLPSIIHGTVMLVR
jgi:gliding motility-associated-like protein